MEDCMCKRRKKENIVIEKENPFDNFELKKPEEVYDENGKRDYFTEYYNAYKNNYIDQYLEAYKKFKAEGDYNNFSPFEENNESNEDENVGLSDLDD